MSSQEILLSEDEKRFVIFPINGVLDVIFKPNPSRPALLDGLLVKIFIFVIPKSLRIRAPVP